MMSDESDESSKGRTEETSLSKAFSVKNIECIHIQYECPEAYQCPACPDGIEVYRGGVNLATGASDGTLVGQGQAGSLMFIWPYPLRLHVLLTRSFGIRAPDPPPPLPNSPK